MDLVDEALLEACFDAWRDEAQASQKEHVPTFASCASSENDEVRLALQAARAELAQAEAERDLEKAEREAAEEEKDTILAASSRAEGGGCGRHLEHSQFEMECEVVALRRELDEERSKHEASALRCCGLEETNIHLENLLDSEQESIFEASLKHLRHKGHSGTDGVVKAQREQLVKELYDGDRAEQEVAVAWRSKAVSLQTSLFEARRQRDEARTELASAREQLESLSRQLQSSPIPGSALGSLQGQFAVGQLREAPMKQPAPAEKHRVPRPGQYRQQEHPQQLQQSSQQTLRYDKHRLHRSSPSEPMLSPAMLGASPALLDDLHRAPSPSDARSLNGRLTPRREQRLPPPLAIGDAMQAVGVDSVSLSGHEVVGTTPNMVDSASESSGGLQGGGASSSRAPSLSEWRPAKSPLHGAAFDLQQLERLKGARSFLSALSHVGEAPSSPRGAFLVQESLDPAVPVGSIAVAAAGRSRQNRCRDEPDAGRGQERDAVSTNISIGAAAPLVANAGLLVSRPRTPPWSPPRSSR